jgi:hypothetical protein
VRVIVWNVQRFTDAKFRDGYVYRGNFKRRRVDFYAAEVLAYMQQIVTGNGTVAHRPDVIAILEVLAPTANNLGRPLPAGSGGADGLIELLGNIKVWTGNANWRLVPPLKCNPAAPAGMPWAQSEVVGVFYDSATIRFDGPNRWIAGTSQPVGAGVPGNYPAPWNVVGNTLNTTNAGMVRFFRANGTEIVFPGAANRRPFVVDLTEIAANRTIRFGFVHTSPGYHLAGTREMADVLQMRGNAAADPPITVFAGDFNVNEYNALDSGYAYAPLAGQNFVRAFSTANQRSTHYDEVSDVRPGPWNNYQEWKLLDTFLVRLKAGGAAAAVAGYAKAAVNCTLGWPVPYATTMNITIANLLTYNNAIEAFRWWENFWHIRKCSDHTPTFLNIT